MEILSLSSGVGTSSHSGSAGSTVTPTESPIILPGMHVVCLENFTQPGCLHITQGDIIEGKHFQEKDTVKNNYCTLDWVFVKNALLFVVAKIEGPQSPLAPPF